MTYDEMMQALDRFRIAYNQMDVPVLEDLLAENVRWGHRNRFSGEGRAELLRSFAEFSKKLPGRYFAEFGRSAVNGNIIFAEQTWHAIPAFSDPAWGWEAGVPVVIETCSLFVFADGKIIEWTDCG